MSGFRHVQRYTDSDDSNELQVSSNENGASIKLTNVEYVNDIESYTSMLDFQVPKSAIPCLIEVLEKSLSTE